MRKLAIAALFMWSAQASAAPAKNIIFFLGDGMGFNTLTAARVYAVGEDGELTIDSLPESAFVKTYSNDAQVTESAAAMSAYMTGQKTNNNVLSMSTGTLAVTLEQGPCQGGRPATTLAELAKARGMAVGIVSTANITDATPAATYAHTCHRKRKADIAAALVGFGADVVLGGGQKEFTPGQLKTLAARGYTIAQDRQHMLAARGPRLFGLFAPDDMHYDQARDPVFEPSLAEMTAKAIGLLAKRKQGFFLMVEGGLIDVALHNSLGKRALQETVAYNAALATAIADMRKIDPDLKNTLIVATADHDHTLFMAGYSPRSGKTTPDNPGVLGLVKRVSDGSYAKDLDGAPYTILGFGNGENRAVGGRAKTALTDAIVTADDYHQEAGVRMAPGKETHGGTDVYLGAIGAGAEGFKGTIENTAVFNLIKAAAGWK